MDTLHSSSRTVIVGAGLTGLMLANRLGPMAHKLTLIEKSRGVGGRMATRRSEAARFDHGAQFYTLQAPIEKVHERWVSSALSSHWFTRDGKSYFKCSKGMTALAKDLAQGLNISFEKRVVSLAQLKNSWRVILDSGEELEAETMILTAPLPQCTEILRQSKLEPDASLLKIQYSKAVVALIEVANVAAGLAGHEGYLEPKSELIFSIADQNLKRLSPVPALTVTLKPEASERLYESTDEEIIATISTELRRLDPGFMATTIQLKKWRNAQPLTRFEDYFFSPAPGLYLAGDAFGGASLNGAARSANALADFVFSDTGHL